MIGAKIDERNTGTHFDVHLRGKEKKKTRKRQENRNFFFRTFFRISKYFHFMLFLLIVTHKM